MAGKTAHALYKGRATTTSTSLTTLLTIDTSDINGLTGNNLLLVEITVYSVSGAATSYGGVAWKNYTYFRWGSSTVLDASGSLTSLGGEAVTNIVIPLSGTGNKDMAIQVQAADTNDTDHEAIVKITAIEPT